MAKVLKCSEVFSGCDTVIYGKDEDEVLAKEEEHARADHNMTMIPMDTIKEMVKAAGWSIDFAASLLGLDDPDNVLPNATWFERFMFRRSFRKSMALGAAIHECGGARMGIDPAKSVLNKFNQCWDAKNVFVTDSSCFVTNGTCGPTLTTMALTMRACEYIAQEYRSTSALSSAA